MEIEKKKLQIGVIGTGGNFPESDLLAERTGELIAASNSILVCGGLTGVMESASRGAKKIGGTVIGVLPGEDPKKANEFVDIKIVTGLGHGRNVIVVRSCDAVIAIGGSYGTLSEIALALKYEIPLIGLRTWDLDSPRNTMIMGNEIYKVNSAEEAVKKALQLAEEFRNNPLPAPTKNL